MADGVSERNLCKRECDCGEFGICNFKGLYLKKTCTCAPFTYEVDGKCIECDCGPHGSCSFESGQKKCVCSPYSIEKDDHIVGIYRVIHYQCDKLAGGAGGTKAIRNHIAFQGPNTLAAVKRCKEGKQKQQY
ncbi:hypothetical protein AVEN_113232-1, partial [Araneus ventricosus]